MEFGIAELIKPSREERPRGQARQHRQLNQQSRIVEKLNCRQKCKSFETRPHEQSRSATTGEWPACARRTS